MLLPRNTTLPAQVREEIRRALRRSGQPTPETPPARSQGIGGPASSPSASLGDVVEDAGGTPSIETGVIADIPAAGNEGAWYLATDEQKLYRDNGAAWEVVLEDAGLPTPSETGALLVSNGSAYVEALPVTNSDGYWVMSEDGYPVVSEV